jgi:hypothetical protein
MSDPGDFEVVDEGTEQAAEDHTAAEGAEDVTKDDVGSEHTIREMLMSTGPDRSLEEVDTPWDPEKGGKTRFYRAFQKMFGVDGTPAVVDLAISLPEMWVSLSIGDDQEDQDDQNEGMPA